MSLEGLLQHFLYPNYSNMMNRPFFVVFNVALLMCAVYLSAYLYMHFKMRKHTTIETLMKPDSKGYSRVIVAIAGLMFLSVFTAMDQQGTATSIFGPSITGLLQTVVTLLDPLLDVSNLTSHPFPDIFGLNLIFRVCIVYILVAAILASGGMAKIICRLFLRFLNHKIFSTEQTESLKDEEGQLNENTTIEDLLTKVLQFAGSGGLLVLLTYIFGSEDTQDNISEILETITEIVETATLLSEVSQDPSVLSNQK